MIATDPLSLVFLGCVVFSGAFLLIAMFSGLGHGHVLHLGHAAPAGHIGHVGHLGHLGHAGHVGHAAHVGHATPHAAPASHATTGHPSSTGSTPTASASAASPSPVATLWSNIDAAFQGSLNVFSLLAFLFSFGLLGYLLHIATNLGAVVAVVVPAACGVAVAVGVGVAMERLLSGATGMLTEESSQLEGRLGMVSMPIHAGGVGEVIFTRPGAGRQSIGARGLDAQSIPVNTEVVIVNVRDGIASVQTWDAFMRGVHEGRAPTLEAIEPGPDPAPPGLTSRP